jgi:hypothetical protein
VWVRHLTLDIAFDDPFAQVNCSRQMIGCVLAFLPHVHEQEFLAAVDLGFYFIDRDLVDAFLGILHDLQKARGMLKNHGSSLRQVLNASQF